MFYGDKTATKVDFANIFRSVDDHDVGPSTIKSDQLSLSPNCTKALHIGKNSPKRSTRHHIHTETDGWTNGQTHSNGQAVQTRNAPITI